MRRLSLLLACTLFSCACALPGAPFPTPYKLSQSYTNGSKWVAVASTNRAKTQTLLLVRDSEGGKTLWKQYLSGRYELQLDGHGHVVLRGPEKEYVLYSYDLYTGKFVQQAAIPTPQVDIKYPETP